MPVLNELTPQPAAAPARSSVVASTSESPIKAQLWFEGAFVFITQNFSRQLANVLVALLTPAALVALALGIWRVCADLGWAGVFVIQGGLFSPWTGWVAL